MCIHYAPRFFLNSDLIPICRMSSSNRTPLFLVMNLRERGGEREGEREGERGREGGEKNTFAVSTKQPFMDTDHLLGKYQKQAKEMKTQYYSNGHRVKNKYVSYLI